MKLENDECFGDISICTENLEKYEVFEEVKYEGQETAGSRWFTRDLYKFAKVRTK